MKKYFLVFLLVIFALQIFAQDTILVTNRIISTGKEGRRVTYGFHQGDKMIISVEVEKGKTLDGIKISTDSETLFSSGEISSFSNKELLVNQTSFVYSDFWGPNLGNRDFELTIKRIPASEEAKFHNTALQKYKTYDTTYINYEIDSVVGYDEIRTPKEFTVINDSQYESVQLSAEKYTIYGGKTKSVMVVKPEERKTTDMKDMEFLGYQILITSAAGAEAMWNNIGIGVDVACLAMNFLLPPGAGVAAGLAVKTAFEMVGPQEGGEPVYYVIMNDEKELAKFTDTDVNTNPAVFESGLATGYTGTWFPMDTLIVGMKNLNMAVEVDVSCAIYAIYQSTTYEKVSQDIVTIKPKTVKVPKTRQVITNSKVWDNQQ